MEVEVDGVVEQFLRTDRGVPPQVTEEFDRFASKEVSVKEFYRGQKILVTGATGFLGGLLVEKLLRSCPQVDKIYVLIRENKRNSQDAQTRLKKLLSSPVYSNSKPEDLKKVVAVAGDISLPGLGLSSVDCQLLRESVNIVFHVAASLNFNSPLNTALNTNALGTRRVLGLCQLMKHVKALVYVSTAYCNCTQRSVVAEQVYPTTFDVDKLQHYLAQLSPEQISKQTSEILSGHPNTYSFTKLIAENIIVKERGSVPVAIVRPSIVLGTMKEPMQGWMENVNNGQFAFIAGAGKGVFRTLLADGRVVADMVPCDLVVNLVISAASQVPHSNKGVEVFHMTSGTKNPLRWSEYADLTISGIYQSPCLYPVWAPGAKCRTNLPWTAFKLFTSQYIPAILLYILAKLQGRTHILLGIQNKYVRGMLLSKYFTVNEWRFDTTHTDQLALSLSDADRSEFSFDVCQISWPEYLQACALGVKRFYHKEGEDVDQIAHKHNLRSSFLDLMTKATVFIICYYFFYNFVGNHLISLAFSLIITYILFYV